MAVVLQIVSRIYVTNVLLVNSNDSPLDMNSLSQCATACGQNVTCASFFYNRHDSLCRLQRGRLKELNMLPSAPYNYYWLYPDTCLSEGYVFLRHAGLCVKAETTWKKWTSAKIYCESSGARLVHLDTEVKYRAVVDEVIADYPDDSFNIGLKDVGDRNWQWTDGSPLTFADWAPDEPNNLLWEYCVNLRGSLGHKFNDDKCYIRYGFICEIVMSL